MQYVTLVNCSSRTAAAAAAAGTADATTAVSIVAAAVAVIAAYGTGAGRGIYYHNYVEELCRCSVCAICIVSQKQPHRHKANHQQT